MDFEKLWKKGSSKPLHDIIICGSVVTDLTIAQYIGSQTKNSSGSWDPSP
jgi:hypothetical protein